MAGDVAGKRGLGLSLRLHNRVLPVLFIAGAVANLATGFVTMAPNRLVSGQPVGLLVFADRELLAPMLLCALGLLATAVVPQGRALHRLAAILAGALLLLLLLLAGHAASKIVASESPLVRVSLGGGFWVVFGAAALAIVDALQRAGAGYGERIAFAAAIIAGFVLMAHLGVFDNLSLAKEYQARQPVFATAVLRHVALVAAAVGPALLIGFPLGVAAARGPTMQAPLFAMLNLFQTIPSIALFGLLLVPLTALATSVPALATLGVGGIGPAPAIIALILYALLPVVRNTVAGLAGVDAGVVDAARGMGMTRRQVLWRVELPLALPLLLGGLRIVTVQAIGLAIVAALIGAGGLGSFVFEGLGQYATDLVLLGALPAIAMALAADFLLQMLSAWAARR